MKNLRFILCVTVLLCLSFSADAQNPQSDGNVSGGEPEHGTVVDCELVLTQDAFNESTSTLPWNGNNSASMPGRGTQDQPYLVTSAAQMACIARWTMDGKSLEGVYFVLMTDLDLSNANGSDQQAKNWKPIGTEQTPFAGKFYGNGHTIKNMSILETDRKKTDYGGVFGYIAPSGVVRDLTVDNSCTVKAETVGAVAAVNNGTISYCSTTATVEGTTVGGIVGINNGTVYGCVSGASVTVLTDGGGIAGKSRGLIERCAFNGSVSYFSLSKHSGGIVGEMLTGGRIADCYTRGKITANIVGVTASAGGIAGNKSLPENSSVTNCYSAGKSGRGGHLTADLTRSLDKVTNCWFDLTAKPLTKNENKNQNFYLENGGLTTDRMQGAEFVAVMNAGRADGPWMDDTEGTNDGYPILFGVEIYRPVYICTARQYLVSTGADKWIHKDGVGMMIFGQRNPQLGEGYTTSLEKDHEWGETDTYYVRNSAGDVVVEYFPEYLMVVYSDEFRTQNEGIRVGMTLAEVKERASGYPIELDAYANTGKLFVKFNDNMVFSIANTALKGGYDAYNDWWMKGGELSLSDVSDDALVIDIRVKK
ncbi:MAG: hypothetical protein LIO85_07675 [Rikenellaceae bacterium]|nr:hypothetical protein [Rikenellaceae bacterium]